MKFFENDFACQIMVAKPELIDLKLKVNFGVDSENKTHSETRTFNQRLKLID